MSIRNYRQAFVGGEVAPQLYGRLDDAKYQSGLALCRNFVVKPQGPAENRSGFQYVAEVKDSSKAVRLIPFTYSTTQTMVIEMGGGYFRFHTNGGTLEVGSVSAWVTGASYGVGDLVSNGGTKYYCTTAHTAGASFATDLAAGKWYAQPATGEYEIPNTYAEADIFDVHYVQSADVLTLVHQGYRPRELRRYGATNWQLAPISFSPTLDAPLGVSVAGAGFTKKKYTYHYVVTAIASDGVSESVQSAEVSVRSNLLETGCTNTVEWSPVDGASRYNVYKQQGGLYGYIGQTTATSMVDDNIAPDMSKTPPIYDNVFQANGIASVPVTAGGSSYGTTVTGGEITAITVDAGGSGYSSPTLQVKDPTGSGATFNVNVGGGGAITSIDVLTEGSGYSSPTFTLVDSSGNNAQISATIAAVGTGSPTLSISDSTGEGAVLVPIVESGAIIGVNVVNPGRGYTAPVVTINDAAGGSGATFGTPTLRAADYPAAVSYFEQRRVFAGTEAQPQSIWMTKSGTESNMSYGLPIRDDDRIAFRVAAREANTIRHIVPLSQLLLLTAAGEWRVTSVNSDAITPTSISVKPQSYVGASNVQPVIVNNSLLYGAARGGHIRELGYSWQANGFVTGDLSLRAPHLFDSYEVIDLAYSKAPQPIVWMVSSSGKLLGLTYVPEQQVGAWHWHDTDGTFKSCCCVAEDDEDVLYVVVQRTINGSSKRYIERQHTRKFSAVEDAFFVDCGLTYDGAAATVISGLGHLEGKTVSILADGAVHPRQVVSSGQITLEQAASKVHIGLPITADLQTLPLAAALQDGSMGQGYVKNINKAWLRVYESSSVFAGPNASSLKEYKQRTNEPYGTPPSLISDEIEIVLTPEWSKTGQVFVRQSNPLPLTVTSMTSEIALGG